MERAEFADPDLDGFWRWCTISVGLWRCSFSTALVFRNVGWGETVYVERRILDFCDLFLTILCDLGEACGWFLMIFLLPMAAHTGSAGVCLHSC